MYPLPNAEKTGWFDTGLVKYVLENDLCRICLWCNVCSVTVNIFVPCNYIHDGCTIEYLLRNLPALEKDSKLYCTVVHNTPFWAVLWAFCLIASKKYLEVYQHDKSFRLKVLKHRKRIEKLHFSTILKWVPNFGFYYSHIDFTFLTLFVYLKPKMPRKYSKKLGKNFCKWTIVP